MAQLLKCLYLQGILCLMFVLLCLHRRILERHKQRKNDSEYCSPESHLVESSMREMSIVWASWKSWKTRLRSETVCTSDTNAVHLEFKYLYMMIYVAFRAGPGQLCRFAMMTLSDLQTILNICLLYVNGYFRILAKKSFLLESNVLTTNFTLNKNFPNVTTVELEAHFSLLLYNSFLQRFRRLCKHIPRTHMSKG